MNKFLMIMALVSIFSFAGTQAQAHGEPPPQPTPAPTPVPEWTLITGDVDLQMENRLESEVEGSSYSDCKIVNDRYKYLFPNRKDSTGVATHFAFMNSTANQILRRTDFSQPLIRAVYDSSREKIQMLITTDESHLHIQSVAVTYSVYRRVNTGDLLNPGTETLPFVVSEFTCHVR